MNVDHSTVHRWVIHFSPQLAERFNRRKRAVRGSWPMDKTYIKVRGRWMYLYRAVDSIGDTVEFFFCEQALLRWWNSAAAVAFGSWQSNGSDAGAGNIHPYGHRLRAKGPIFGC